MLTSLVERLVIAKEVIKMEPFEDKILSIVDKDIADCFLDMSSFAPGLPLSMQLNRTLKKLTLLLGAESLKGSDESTNNSSSS